MDPLERIFYFHSWAKKHEVDIELFRNHAILTGSFSNPEMARRMTKKPDYMSTEEDLERSWEYVKSQPVKNEGALGGISNDGKRASRRRRRVLK